MRYFKRILVTPGPPKDPFYFYEDEDGNYSPGAGRLFEDMEICIAAGDGRFLADGEDWPARVKTLTVVTDVGLLNEVRSHQGLPALQAGATVEEQRALDGAHMQAVRAAMGVAARAAVETFKVAGAAAKLQQQASVEAAKAEVAGQVVAEPEGVRDRVGSGKSVRDLLAQRTRS